MAIYGLNFNGSTIPPAYVKVFKPRRRIYSCSNCGKQTLATGPECLTCFQGTLAPVKPLAMATLQGVAETRLESDAMLVQADNGHRKVFRVTNPTGEVVYGIYCY